MKAVELRPGVTISTDGIAESFTRDLEGEDGVHMSRDKASSVELRVDVRCIEPLDATARARLMDHPDVHRSGRHVVSVQVTEEGSRHRNLHEARRRMKIIILEAIDDEVPQPELPQERTRRPGAGLTKRRTRS